MIRFVRRHAESDAAPAGLDATRRRGQLDLLQLDYVRPRLAPVAGPAPPELPEVAGSFADAVRSLGKTLFLEPELRVVASAGWSSSYVLAERVGQTLVEAGCPETPVSAVRGSNILPILDDLVAGGVQAPQPRNGRRLGDAASADPRRRPAAWRRAPRRGARRRRPRHRRRVLRRRRAGDRRRQSPPAPGRGRSWTISPAPRPRLTPPCGRSRHAALWKAAGAPAACPRASRASNSPRTARSPSTSPTPAANPTHAACSPGCRPARRAAPPTSTPTCGTTPRAPPSQPPGRRSFASPASPAPPTPTAGGSRSSTSRAFVAETMVQFLPGAAASAAAANGRGVPHAIRRRRRRALASHRAGTGARRRRSRRRQLAPPRLPLAAPAAVPRVRRGDRQLRRRQSHDRPPPEPAAPPSTPNAASGPPASPATPSTSPSTRARRTNGSRVLDARRLDCMAC